MRRVVESDICIVGSGISAAMIADRLARTTSATVVVVEAGDDTVPLPQRAANRERFLRYNENPWGRDHIDGYEVDGPLQSRSMQVGGLAMHWGGVTPRFSPEDFKQRTMFGVGTDWPISYDDLDPFYQEAEEIMGVAGEQGPAALDPRGKPFPLPALPLTYNLELLKGWATKAGIATWSQPSAKNSVPYRGRAVCCRNDTCSPICPVGAKYSPDFTWNTLRRGNKTRLVTRTLVRKIVLAADGKTISHLVAVDRDRPNEPVEFHAKSFVIAAGYTWSSHLLLLSTQAGAPDGVANRSGLVGKYLAGHRNVSGYVDLPLRLYPGMSDQHSLVTKQFMRLKPGAPYVRHDLRIWESSVGKAPRLTDDTGALMLGDAILDDWRARTKTGTARVRSYYDVIPDKSSELTLDATRKNAWGDPLPKLAFRDAPESVALRAQTEDSIKALFGTMAVAGGGKLLRTAVDNFQDHPSGGCRMGTDGAASVVDSWGRAHDHENLFITGAPTCVSGSCANATLTFCALSLRTAHDLEKRFPRRGA
ncbi:MAG: GMC family oxidoreductase [Gemmatimonadaceae bacterium]